MKPTKRLLLELLFDGVNYQASTDEYGDSELMNSSQVAHEVRLVVEAFLLTCEASVEKEVAP